MAKDSPEEIKSAHDWLNKASASLDVSPDVTRALVGDLLDLTRNVAHGPSRAAAPVTAFLVGLASGRADMTDEQLVAQVRANIAHINSILEEYSNSGTD
ncbi:DUF6457 domain-containing protein [Corynebacterium lubricantis]|uniref:DUF6457 domain-containing protein n=1 Tax=Corynebacterium lubricantis TaxID=541095 RepID=UPI00036B1413|nr:DUF6457 domain-containing protein [Corynebacterium lubricantis]